MDTLTAQDLLMMAALGAGVLYGAAVIYQQRLASKPNSVTALQTQWQGNNLHGLSPAQVDRIFQQQVAAQTQAMHDNMEVMLSKASAFSTAPTRTYRKSIS